MLLETPYKASDAVTVMTSGGSEVIGRFVEENNETITLEKPMVVMATQQGLGLGPFSFTINPSSKLKLNKSALLFVHKTDGEMAKQYLSSTSSIQMV